MGPEPDPVLVPLDGSFAGRTYADLSVDWWQWAMGLTVTGHPLFDDTGADCAVGQSGDVWFLGGAFASGSVERSCSVPVDQAILFPILNAVWDNAGVPEEDWGTDAELQGALTAWMDIAYTLTVE